MINNHNRQLVSNMHSNSYQFKKNYGLPDSTQPSLLDFCLVSDVQKNDSLNNAEIVHFKFKEKTIVNVQRRSISQLKLSLFSAAKAIIIITI